MKKGIVYSVSLTILLIFVTLFINSLVNSYQNINDVFNEFLINKKSVDDYQAIKYSLQRVIGIENSFTLNLSFPFYLSVDNIGPVLESFVEFVNTTYAASRFSNVKLNATELISIVNSGALDYQIVPYSVQVEKQPGFAEKIIIWNITELRGIYIKVVSDAIVIDHYWKPPGMVAGNFNFTFDEIGVLFNYSIDIGYSRDYIIDFEKDGNSVGFCVISFEPSQNQIRIEERNIKFSEVDDLTFIISFEFEESSIIITKPSVYLKLSDWLNKTSVNGAI
ncbi:MAG: hypothetical protein GON13_03250 [Nanoarchaeota archaeon]|nr:hypothetical protein [Nanoarchaeota archaeon]